MLNKLVPSFVIEYLIQLIVLSLYRHRQVSTVALWLQIERAY